MSRDTTVSVSIIDATVNHPQPQSPQTELDSVVSVNWSYIDTNMHTANVRIIWLHISYLSHVYFIFIDMCLPHEYDLQ
jgi:hypothetical protein